MIRIAVADDHKIFLQGLLSLIEQMEGITCIGHALTGKQFLQVLEKEEFDIAVLDINMPELGGIELCEILTKRQPTVPVLILSSFKERKPIQRAIQAGAMGYVIKENGQEELSNAIHKIFNGKKYFSDSVMDIVIEIIEKGEQSESNDYREMLTPREIEVLIGIVEGLKTREIGEKMFISEATVASHRKNIHSKFHVSNLGQLIRFVNENKILDHL